MSADKKTEWTLVLNKYHRDNLLNLIRACGYPNGDGVEPFTYANTGDWIGELYWTLDGKYDSPDSDETPNCGHDHYEKSVESWLSHRDGRSSNDENT